VSVSVIGLGKIGSEIVPHLLSLGEVKVWNRSQAAIDRVVGMGATAARDLSDAFASDLVISALFDDQAVLATLTSELISQAAPQTLCRFAFNSEICRVWRRQTPFFALKCETTIRFVRWYLMSRRNVGSQSGDRSDRRLQASGHLNKYRPGVIPFPIHSSQPQRPCEPCLKFRGKISNLKAKYQI
jgi:hypothetical protein